MGRCWIPTLTRLVLVAAVMVLCISLGSHALAQNGNGKAVGKGTLTTCTINGKTVNNCTPGMVKQANRQAAAKDLKAKRQAAVAAGVTIQAYTPSLGPDYFGTTPNYANSPVPTGSIGTIVPVFGGTGYSLTPTVTITDAYNPAATGATATATVTAGVITGFTVGGGGGGGYMAPVVTITDATGVGALARAALAPTTITGGLRKFVDTLPVPPIATSTACTFSGQAADCYEIWLVEYRQQMHADLPPVAGTWPNQTGGTLLRGYVDAPGGVMGTPSYLGPLIIAQRDKPVRVTFKNKLPVGTGGNLSIPVDTTYMGAGAGANGGTLTQNRAAVHLHGGTTPWISDGTVHQWITPANDTTTYPKGVSVRNVPDMGTGCDAVHSGCMTFYYTNQQSARLMFYHDHAEGLTRLNVYAGEAAGYLLQDPVEQTLPIPAGGAAGLTNSTGVPLVIQDKTFVPGPIQLQAQDPSWAALGLASSGIPSVPNGDGYLWFPHVYMTNQNPWNLTGANAMGRWDYGPWFWPPFTGLVHSIQPNPYAAQPGEPPSKPGVPDTDANNTWSYGSKASGTPESFMDTPVVNGKAYPTLTVPAGPVRFRILSVGNDRMLNLSLFVAADKTGPPTTAGAIDPGTLLPAVPTLCKGGVGTPANCTEVAMVPFNSAQNALTPFPSWWYTIVTNGFTFDDRAGGVPDPRTRGPAMIQIGTEGGLLPAPVVIPNQPVNYVYNRRDITVGNVNEHALLLGPAERADVIVDFTNFAGSTLILYNDSPAPVPAADPRLDYYTGDPDNTDTGGAPSTQPGYGPNTRTVMQIVVSGTGGTAPVDDVNATLLTSLQTALPAAFKASQDLVIVPQAAYNPVYGTVVTDVPGSNLAGIADTALTFTPLAPNGTLQAAALTVDMEPKAIIEDFTVDYGRMNAILGVEIKHTNSTNQTSIIQGYADPPTELVKVADPAVVPIGALADGSQIWKITHNGVDTHAIHFHMFNVQIVNRVGWDGAIRPPQRNELGFKDTVRMNPLEDIIVATRPIQLKNVPFIGQISDSVRLMAPSRPLGATLTATGAPLFANVDPAGNPVTVTNQNVNFGWEYVWHCHILGHEENDMMRALVVAVPPPAVSSVTIAQPNGPRRVVVSWKDNSANETGFIVERATNSAFTANLVPVTVPGSAQGVSGATMTYTDTTVAKTVTYYYRVTASNQVGGGNVVVGYPTLTANALPVISAPVSITVK